eukprot:6818326-Alexandrium_andersonii.AAC.1
MAAHMLLVMLFAARLREGPLGVMCFGARCTWARTLRAADAQGRVPRAEAAHEDARRAWMFLRLRRSP